mgnify:CR=1 FL=1
MGYSAARGGLEAILAAEKLIADERWSAGSAPLTDDQCRQRLGAAVDRVMGEGGIWDDALAAAALRQAEGDTIEAAHLLRAHRSTLPRFAYAEVADADDIEILRRVVPAYQRPPGPQLLGRTADYTGRLLQVDQPSTSSDPRSSEDPGMVRKLGLDVGAAARPIADAAPGSDPTPGPDSLPGADTATEAGSLPAGDPVVDPRRPTRLLQILRDLDLVVDRRRQDDPPPVDITRTAVRPPAPRSARLATMARAETGALVNLWYRNILGPDGYLHEITLGEVRHGRLPVVIRHAVTDEPIRIGEVRVTEVEAIEDLDGIDEDRARFDVGYGMCFGHNEKKAIAMANLDIACHRDQGRSQLEQSILLTTDGLDATGFLEHLKLPHYVTFRSMVERKMAVREARRDGAAAGDELIESNGSDCA